MGSGSSQPDGISGNADDEQRPSLAIAGDGQPFVAFAVDAGTDSDVYLLRFDGSGWNEYIGSASGGGVSNSDLDAAQPAVAAGDGKLCVAWQEGTSPTQILVRCALE